MPLKLQTDLCFYLLELCTKITDLSRNLEYNKKANNVYKQMKGHNCQKLTVLRFTYIL